MSSYHKSISPPKGEPYLQTADGLKYWLVKHPPSPGLQESVLTEDETISFHAYGGSREQGCTYLFRYKGFEIGIFCQDSSQGYYPCRDVDPFFDKEANSVTYVVTGIGTPVWDEAATLIHDGKGGAKVDLKARRRGEGYVTGLTFEDYNNGRRTEFESRAQQDEMLELLPYLFTGQKINLMRLLPGWEDKPLAFMRFSDDLKQEYEIVS